MRGKRVSALLAAGLAGAVMISGSHAVADNTDAPALLPIGRILLQETLVEETAGKPRPDYDRDLTGASIPADNFPLPSCSFPRGLCGAVDRNGAVVIPPVYDFVDFFRQRRAIVRTGRLYGVVHTTGRLIAPVEYDEVKFLSNDLFLVVRDGKTGLTDFDGRSVVEPRFSVISPIGPDVIWLVESPAIVQSLPPASLPDASNRFIPGIGRFSLPPNNPPSPLHIGGKVTLIQHDGRTIREFPHIEARTFDPARALVWAKTDTLWGLMTANGGWVLKPRFEDVWEPSDGLVAVKLGGKWGYADSDGRVVISPRFTAPGWFVKGRKLGRQPDTFQEFGLIDRTGKWVVVPRYELLAPAHTRQSGGDYWLGRLASGWDLLNDSGELIAHIEGALDQPPTLCADGRFQGLRNKEWVLFDPKGHPLLPPEGWLAHADCSLRFVVNVDGRAGVVDAAMRWIVPPKFEAISTLGDREGHLLTRINDKYGVMGPDGNWILDPAYDFLKVLAAGTFAASRDGKYGVLRIDGVWLVEPKYDYLKRLFDDRYAVQINDKYGVLLTDGTWLVEPSFEDVKPLTFDHIVARTAGKYGVYDMRAKAWLVEPKSDEMCGFSDKYAVGITDGLRTIFDAYTGEMLIGPRYNRLSMVYEDGLVAVRLGDKWGYADLRGDLVIPAQFRNMSRFRRGIAWGEHEGKMCPLDRRGRWVMGIPCVEPDEREREAWLPRPWCRN